MAYSKFSGAVCLLVFLPLILTAQRTPETVVPLKNWATPLYWQPNQAEREAAARASSQNPAPQLQFSTNQVSTNALTFVAVTPCRLVDTRGASAGFNGDISPFDGPSLTAGETVTFPVQSSTEAAANTEPAPCGTIPSIAEAYSLNVTVVPHSSGVVDYVSIWPAGGTQPIVSTLNDTQGQIVANAAIVPAGTPSGGVSVYNSGPAVTDVIIDMNGFFAAPTDLLNNTAVGLGALASNTTGSLNTASGVDALYSNTTGSNNTASGYDALVSNTTGYQNTVSGYGALKANAAGSNNIASGYLALQNNTTGSGNTASGTQVLNSNTTGSNNVAIGTYAGFYAPAGNSNSIYIGSDGSAADNSGTIQIGTQGTQTGGTYIAGISGASVSGGVAVYVTSSGQLGIAPSSGRFKEQITDMGDASNKLLQLRPVTFFYKPQYDDGSHELQYGLIAEEVAKVYPEMVAYGKDGQILTVKYQLLDPMLLNEVQKQAEQIRQQAEQNRKLEDRLTALEALLGKVPATATALATTPAEAKIGLQNLEE